MANEDPPKHANDSRHLKRHVDHSYDDIANDEYDAMEGVDWEFTVHDHARVVAQRTAARLLASQS